MYDATDVCPLWAWGVPWKSFCSLCLEVQLRPIPAQADVHWESMFSSEHQTPEGLKSVSVDLPSTECVTVIPGCSS